MTKSEIHTRAYNIALSVTCTDQEGGEGSILTPSPPTILQAVHTRAGRCGTRAIRAEPQVRSQGLCPRSSSFTTSRLGRAWTRALNTSSTASRSAAGSRFFQLCRGEHHWVRERSEKAHFLISSPARIKVNRGDSSDRLLWAPYPQHGFKAARSTTVTPGPFVHKGRCFVAI